MIDIFLQGMHSISSSLLWTGVIYILSSIVSKRQMVNSWNIVANASFCMHSCDGSTMSHCDLHEYLAESGAICFASLQVRERCARFPLSRHIRPMVANHELVRFRGHVMLQSHRRSHFEA